MPRILQDPTRAVCPSFEDPEWDFLRQPMIEAHVGDNPLTVDDATQRMREAWTRENDRRITAWNAQLEQDRAEQEERDRLAQEEQEVQRARQEREAEEQRREAEKKKPKFEPFDPNRPVNATIEPRPAPYALGKIKTLEYIELDYFTARGCREAMSDTSKSISQDTLAFTQIDDTISIQPMAAIRPSKHIRNDEDLSWEEMLGAKNTMLRFIAKSGAWPASHIESLATFYVNLELHSRATLPLGKQTLLLYQSRVRREWFDAFDRKQGFNIELIEDNLLRTMAEELNGRIVSKEMDQVQYLPVVPRRNCSLTRAPSSLFFAFAALSHSAPSIHPLFPANVPSATRHVPLAITLLLFPRHCLSCHVCYVPSAPPCCYTYRHMLDP
jgi:hypothetical protein